MAVRIAHASIDERGKISGGLAGDQSGKEVCIRTWYSKPWQYVIRCKNAAMREKIAYAMERAANNNLIGYDQSQRNTLLSYARNVGYDPGKVINKCETDCSALVSLACIYAGVSESSLIKGGNSSTTSTIRKNLIATGEFEAYSARKYLSNSDYLLRGDILLKEGSHVVVVIDNGAKSSSTTSSTNNTDRLLKVDGLWGINTTKRLQQIFGTTPDGIISNQYISEKNRNPGLSNQSGWEWKTSPSVGSLLIKAIQKKVGVTQDGWIGKNTITAMQKWLGSSQDGIISNPSQMVKSLQTWCNKQ